MYERCPVKGTDLGKLTKNTGANNKENTYANWHMEQGQWLKAKYRNGKRMKQVR